MPKTRANLEQGYDLQALLANVAVSPDYRYPPGPLYALSHPVTTFFRLILPCLQSKASLTLRRRDLDSLSVVVLGAAVAVVEDPMLSDSIHRH